MKKSGAVLLGIVLFFVLAQGAYATTTVSLQRPVCTINASSYSVRLGGTVNLTWSSQYATAGTITSLGNVALYGSQGVIPTGEGTTYVGTFTGPGGTGTCSVRVSTILNDGGGGDIDTPGSLNAPGTLGAPPVQNAAPIQPGGSGGGSSGGGASKQLVPCNGIDCQACKLADLGQNIINFLVGLSIPLAAVMFAYAGFIYFTSSVIDKIEKAKKIFTSVLIGFAIVIGGYLIVETILHALLNESYWKSWNQIQCVPDDSRETKATIADLLKNLYVTNSGSTSTGPGGSGGGESDATNRDILKNAGIGVNAGYPQTSLAGMRPETMNEIMDICGNVPKGQCIVTGGTETTGGHSCGGEYSHCNGYKFDLRTTEALDTYLWKLSKNQNTFTYNGWTYTRENNGKTSHWDVGPAKK
ncbi:MAG TPA: pilin [Candidatus Paceibacterota bacterium]